MTRRLKAAGIEPVVCLWHFTFPDWLYDEKNPKRSNWLHPDSDARWQAYVNKVVPGSNRTSVISPRKTNPTARSPPLTSTDNGRRP